MAGTSVDLEVLKDIPGYRMILKSVLKSQIQLLIEQLSEHAGEETIILTASVHDGTLSHLGSSTGKGFFDGRDEIKSQFLGYCLKSQHKKKASDSRSSPYQRPQSSISSQRRPRAQNVPVRQGSPSVNASNPPEMHRAPNHASNGQSDSSVNVKQETSEQITSKTKSGSFVAESVTFPSSLQLNHTQTSAEQLDDTNDHHGNENEYTEHESENDENTATSIKIEPITENEMELEITGVEPGKPIDDPSGWGEGHSVGASIVGDSSTANEGDQSGYTVFPSVEHGMARASPALLQCSFCHKVFGPRALYERHMRQHTGEKPFKCRLCSAAFSRRWSYIVHLKKKHVGEITQADLVHLPNVYA